MKTPSRTITTVAVGFLLLDAVLLVWGGIWAHKTALIIFGGVCALGALGVVIGWSRYVRALADVERAKQDLKTDVAEIRELLHKHRST